MLFFIIIVVNYCWCGWILPIFNILDVDECGIGFGQTSPGSAADQMMIAEKIEEMSYRRWNLQVFSWSFYGTFYRLLQLKLLVKCDIFAIPILMDFCLLAILRAVLSTPFFTFYNFHFANFLYIWRLFGSLFVHLCPFLDSILNH